MHVRMDFWIVNKTDGILLGQRKQQQQQQQQQQKRIVTIVINSGSISEAAHTRPN